MGKKKDKTFSFNNTHGHGIYPPVYPVGQRYPHTDFHHNDPFWIYEELGILKDWIISLTKLGGMLAQTETDDISDIIDELKDIISKLESLFNGLYNSLNKLYDAEVDYNDSLVSALELSSNLALDINNFINALNPIFESLFDCIENRLSVDDKNIYNINQNISSVTGDITDIKNEINNIYNFLESEYSSKSITLTEGTDYDIIFFNGFRYSEAEYGAKQTVLVQLETRELLNKTFYTLHIFCGHSSSGEHSITNDYIYTSGDEAGNCPIFNHDSSWRDTPNSWLFMVKFKGSYEFLNNLTDSSYEQGPTDPIFNMSPTSARASWAPNIGATISNVATNDGSLDYGYGLILALTNISDGINQQYYTYCDLGLCDNLSFGRNLNVDVIVNTHA